MRYRFVDCRWELGNPGRGLELYLAGHVPGRRVPRRRPRPLGPARAGRTAPAAVGRRLRRGRRAARGSGRASSSSRTGTWAARSGSGGCCGTSATTTARCSTAASTPGSARCARATRRSSRRRSSPVRAPTTRSPPTSWPRRPRRARRRRRAAAGALARRAEPDRQAAGPRPGSAQRAVAETRRRSFPTASSSPTAARASPRASRSTGSRCRAASGRLYPGGWSEWGAARAPARARLGRRALALQVRLPARRDRRRGEPDEQRGRRRARRLWSCIASSSSSRLPLRRLHGAHEVTTFSHTESPPRLRGTTWSSVSRPLAVPQ